MRALPWILLVVVAALAAWVLFFRVDKVTPPREAPPPAKPGDVGWLSAITSLAGLANTILRDDAATGSGRSGSGGSDGLITPSWN